MLNHLNNEDTYKKVESNPINLIKNNMNAKLKLLEKSKKLSRQQYLHLYSNTAITPRIYGLIKLHKDNHPIRPIISFCNSPTYNLSKFLCKIRNPLTDTA